MKDEKVSLEPGLNADKFSEIKSAISRNVLERYDVYSYRHAASILNNSFREQLSDIEQALDHFKITTFDIGLPGGNESKIPKKFSTVLRPLGWKESRVQGDLIVRVIEEKYEQNVPEKSAASPLFLNNYIDGHKVDYVKDRVALDVEWNSKDQTYDRDLYAFRMFHECGIISVAVLVTRSEKLNPVFSDIPKRKRDGSVVLNNKGEPIPCKSKYGASTTWMGKLLYRLNAGRHGGCPVLVIGIRPDVIEDLTN